MYFKFAIFEKKNEENDKDLDQFVRGE
jgi:hypothetical protein